MIHPDGAVANEAFQIDGKPAIDNERLFYYGGSQGGIMGGSLTAVSPDFDRGVLGVPGMNYSTLLQRSIDFDTYSVVMYAAYPDELERQLVLSMIQMLWDRAESNGYAHHMTDDPYPNTPPHEVLLVDGLRRPPGHELGDDGRWRERSAHPSARRSWIRGAATRWSRSTASRASPSSPSAARP